MGTSGGSHPLLLQWLIVDLLDSGLTKVHRLKSRLKSKQYLIILQGWLWADCFDSVVDG